MSSKIIYYNSISLLGRGTFGTVHLCETLHNKQKVVVKQIILDSSKETLTMAKNEVSILKSMRHPNVIEYLDSYIKESSLFIVMEFASQGTLRTFLDTTKPNKLSPQMVVNFFCQILMGLHHIHSKKIVHRDLKCENIFLTGIQSDIIKIGDFGISKVLINNKHANTFIGTYYYISPELCDGKPYNTKSDIWSLGCILYELCELEKMFDGTLANIILKITSGQKKQVDVKYYGVQIQEMIDSMLKLNPDERLDTVALMSLPDIFPTLYCLQNSLGCVDKDSDVCKSIYYG